MILSRPDLIDAWKTGKIGFRPDILERQIGLSSIDLRLGYVYARLKNIDRIIRPASQGFDPTNLVVNYDLKASPKSSKRPTLRIKPREFILAMTLERVAVPGSLAANVQGKSSLARTGLAVHITAPHIQQGFVAPITLELYNHGPWTLEFFPGKDLVCQLIFFKTTKSVSAAMIKSLSTYMHQTTPFPPHRRNKPH